MYFQALCTCQSQCRVEPRNGVIIHTYTSLLDCTRCDINCGLGSSLASESIGAKWIIVNHFITYMCLTERD